MFLHRCTWKYSFAVIVQSLSVWVFPNTQILCDPMDYSTADFPFPSPFPGVCSNSHTLSWWSHPTISSSVIPFFFWLQSFPASGSFPMSQLFASGNQSIEASASASVLPMNIQGLFPLGLTNLISLLSKGLSRVFSSTRIQRHQFFSAQHFLLSSSHILYMTTGRTITYPVAMIFHSYEILVRMVIKDNIIVYCLLKTIKLETK